MPKLLEKLGLIPPPGFVPELEAGAVSARGAPGVGEGSPARGGEGGGALPKAPPAPALGGGVQPGPGTQAAGPAGAKAGSSPEMVLYAKERLAVTRLRGDLGKHKQAAHVADKTGQADLALAAAATHAATPDWPKAMAELASARTACEDGKRFADAFADFLTKRAEANLVLSAAQTSGWTGLAGFPPLLASADTKAAPAVRNYAAAKTDLDAIVNGLAPFFKTFYVDNVKPKIAALKTLATAKFIAPEITALDKLMSQQETGITAKQWRQVRLNDGLIGDRIAAAQKIAGRRADYDIERPKVDAAIKALDVHGKAVAVPLAAIQQRVKDADAMASKAGMQFEDAKSSLAPIIATCGAVDRVAGEAGAYTTERGALAADLAKLRQDAAAAKIKGELDVVRGLLDEAAQAAGDKGAPGTQLMLGADPASHDIATAKMRLGQARANLATARNLADALGGVAAVEGLVGDKPNVTALRKGVDALAAELAAALKADHAALAKAEFDAVQGGLDEARKQIDAKQPDAAAQSLAAASRHMIAGRRIQIEHSQFLQRHEVLKQRLAQYNANKAQAAKVQLKLDELTKAVKDADAAETSGDHAQAMAELDKGEAAAGAVDAAATNRAAFDKEANLAALDLEKPANASIKAAQLKEITRARALAFVMDFDGANKTVKSVRNAIAALEAEGMATKAPPDPALADKAKKLAEAGATKELDELIKKLPPTLDKQVFIDLAQARFKVTFEVEADGNEQESMKRMCELMKDIPEDVIGNPSLKKIKRRVTREDGGTNKDGTNTQQFPFYQANQNEVVMNSRPKQWNKPDFEPGAAGRLPEREEKCKPANNKREDLFDFNMLHELAHSIDDAKNYMAVKGKDPDHGGWIAVGGNVEMIVEAVIKETGFGNSAEERQYVLDSILRNPAVPPATFKGDKARFDSFVAAAQTDNVWDSQTLTDQATLGKRVFHEGYPNTWFSYLADARKRGITSYQFRAPGEWFSELYAA
ncbi:MAG: hypothetical protein ACXWCC_17740, partial [Caldimonas sp.]